MPAAVATAQTLPSPTRRETLRLVPPVSAPPLTVVEAAGLSDTGRIRTVNQDAFLSGTAVHAVADGVGGAAGGGVAAAIAIEGLAGLDGGLPSCAALRTRIDLAHRTIGDLAVSAPHLRRMATTLTAAAVLPGSDELAVAHVGDSRLYRLRAGRLDRLTEDHTLGAELERESRGDNRAARSLSHVLTRALGLAERGRPDVATHPLADGDLYLLCSDGLTTYLADEELAEMLAGDDALRSIARRLVGEANARGGADNITVALLRCGYAG